MERLSLLSSPLELKLFCLADQTLRNFLFTRSLIAAVVLALAARLLQGTRFSWLFPG